MTCFILPELLAWIMTIIKLREIHNAHVLQAIDLFLQDWGPAIGRSEKKWISNRLINKLPFELHKTLLLLRIMIFPVASFLETKSQVSNSHAEIFLQNFLPLLSQRWIDLSLKAAGGHTRSFFSPLSTCLMTEIFSYSFVLFTCHWNIYTKRVYKITLGWWSSHISLFTLVQGDALNAWRTGFNVGHVDSVRGTHTVLISRFLPTKTTTAI